MRYFLCEKFGLGIYLALVLPRDFWFKFSLPTHFKIHKPIAFLSDIAFPLFLIHHPFLFAVKFLVDEWSVPRWTAITLFMISVSLIAWLLSSLDRRFPRKQIEQKLIG